MKHIISFVLVLILFLGILSGCGVHTKLVRERYSKISSLSTESNIDKFSKSSFNNFLTYKTSLYCDFGITYFTSYYYYSRSQYSSTYISILSSMLYPGENNLTFGNIFSNAKVNRDSEITIVSYLILEEFIITKAITLELVIKTDTLTPGRYRGTISDSVAALTLKDEKGKILFDISDENSYINMDIESVQNNIAYGTFKAQLVGHKKEIYLTIKEGEFWVKL